MKKRKYKVLIFRLSRKQKSIKEKVAISRRDNHFLIRKKAVLIKARRAGYHRTLDVTNDDYSTAFASSTVGKLFCSMIKTMVPVSSV